MAIQNPNTHSKWIKYNDLKVLTTICPIDKYEDNNKEYYKIDWGSIE